MTNQSIVGGKRKIKLILSTVIALVLIIAFSASTALAGTSSQYDVSIVDNGEQITVTTVETEPIKILNNAGIVLANDDKMDISAFAAGEGGTINVSRLNSIHIDFEGSILNFNVYSSSVGDALSEIGISITDSDRLNYSLNDRVVEGMVITLKSKSYVKVFADGREMHFPAVSGTVGDLIGNAGILLGTEDYTEPSINTSLSAGMAVTVCRVEYKQLTETEELEYSTIEKKNEDNYAGISRVVTKGINGIKDVTYQVKYVNGIEAERTPVNEVTVQECVDEVIEVGAKETKGTTDVKPNSRQSYNGIKVGDTISGRSTRYCSCAKCCGKATGVTASGKRVYTGMADPYYVALNWLPMGSVINVNGTNYTVVDRGGSGLSRKGRVDIYTPQGHQACFRLGAGACTITIIRIGW